MSKNFSIPPLFGYESNNQNANQWRSQKKRAHPKCRQITSNLSKTCGYVPLVGTAIGITRIADSCLDYKASSKEGKISGKHLAGRFLRGVVEAFSLGIIFLPADVVISVYRHYKLKKKAGSECGKASSDPQSQSPIVISTSPPIISTSPPIELPIGTLTDFISKEKLEEEEAKNRDFSDAPISDSSQSERAGSPFSNIHPLNAETELLNVRSADLVPEYIRKKVQSPASEIRQMQRAYGWEGSGDLDHIFDLVGNNMYFLARQDQGLNKLITFLCSKKIDLIYLKTSLLLAKSAGHISITDKTTNQELIDFFNEIKAFRASADQFALKNEPLFVAFSKDSLTFDENRKLFILKWRYESVITLFSSAVILPPQFSGETDLYFSQLRALRSPLLRERILNRLPLLLDALPANFKFSSQNLKYSGVPLLPIYCELILCLGEEKADIIYTQVFKHRRVLKNKLIQNALLELIEGMFDSVESEELKIQILMHVLSDSKMIGTRAKEWIYDIREENFKEHEILHEFPSAGSKDWSAFSQFLYNLRVKDLLMQINSPPDADFENKVTFSLEQVRTLRALFAKLRNGRDARPETKQRATELIKAICASRYREERYKELNDKLLTREENALWQTNFEEISEEFTGRETDDPWDMLLATEKISGCQSIFSPDAGRMGPIPFFCSATYRLITIEDKKGNTIIRAYIGISEKGISLDLYAECAVGRFDEKARAKRDRAKKIFNKLFEKKTNSLGKKLDPLEELPRGVSITMI